MARAHRVLQDSKDDELSDTGCFGAWLLRSRELSRLVGYAEVQIVFSDIRGSKTLRQQGKGH